MGENTNMWRVVVGSQNATSLNNKQKILAKVNLGDVMTLNGPAKMSVRCEYVSPIIVNGTSAYDSPIELQISTIGQTFSYDSRLTSQCKTLAVLEPSNEVQVKLDQMPVTSNANQFVIRYYDPANGIDWTSLFSIQPGLYTGDQLAMEINAMWNNAFMQTYPAYATATNQQLYVTFNPATNKFTFTALGYVDLSGLLTWTLIFSTGVPKPANQQLGFTTDTVAADWRTIPVPSQFAVPDFVDPNQSYQGYKFSASLGDCIVNREFMNQQEWLCELVYMVDNQLFGPNSFTLSNPLVLEDWMAVLTFRW